MRIDRRAFLATLGTAAAIGAMPSETLADALEHHMMETLDEQTTTNELKIRRGAGFLFGGPSPSGRPLPANGNLELMPEKPTLADFFKYRFAPATHVLQSATHATKGGENEETILACLLHDVVLNMIKVDHGWWGAQILTPYVSEKVRWAIRYHQALRFYQDPPWATNTPRCTPASTARTTCRHVHQEGVRRGPQPQVVHGGAHDHRARPLLL